MNTTNPAGVIADRAPSRLTHWRGVVVLITVALLGLACAALNPTPKLDSSLHELGEATSADFRRAFDEAQGKTRFIVALSPT